MRLRINNVGTLKGVANPIQLASTSTTTATWSLAPTNMPTVASPNILVITVQPTTPTEEIIYVTAYTAGATSATVVRAAEGPGTARAHATAPWVHGPTATDFIGGTTVNSGPLITTGQVALVETKQPLVQPSGIPQPLPPLFGFNFSGAHVSLATLATTTTSVGTTHISLTPTTPPRVAFPGVNNCICVGRNRNIWVRAYPKVLEFSPQGVLVATHTVGTTAGYGSICVGSTGGIWVFVNTTTATRKCKLKRIAPTGAVTTSGMTGLPKPATKPQLFTGVDGYLYVLTTTSSGIHRFNPLATSGVAYGSTVFSVGLSPSAYPWVMCAGSDGFNYCLSSHPGTVGGTISVFKFKMTGTRRVIKRYPITTTHHRAPGPRTGMCTGPDNRVWFSLTTNPTTTATQKCQVGAIDATGNITIYTTGLVGVIKWLVAGAGGDIWGILVHTGTAKLLLITVEGTVHTFATTATTGNLIVGVDGSFISPKALTSSPFQMVCGGMILTSLGLTTTKVTLTAGGSYITTTAVTIIAPHTVVSGTAFQPSTTKDTEIFFDVTTAGSVKVAYGPTATATHVIMTTVAMPIGATFTKRIPAGWYVKITLSVPAVISTVKIQSV